MTNVYVFQSNENDQILPQFDQTVLNDLTSFKNIHIDILGKPMSSLISIHDIADFFTYQLNNDCEWEFTETEYIEANHFIAILKAC